MLIKCPECGKEVSDKSEICIHCGYPLLKSKENTKIDNNQLLCVINDKVLNLYSVKQYIDADDFTKAMLEFQRITNSSFSEAKRAIDYIQKNNKQFPERFLINKPKTNIPKCPTCGSTNIRKISVGQKLAGSIGFGLLSRTAKSQFECLNCKYKW